MKFIGYISSALQINVKLNVPLILGLSLFFLNAFKCVDTPFLNFYCMCDVRNKNVTYCGANVIIRGGCFLSEWDFARHKSQVGNASVQ